MSDEREDRERKENHRHEEELKKMENERILKEKQIENEKEYLKNTKEDNEHNHDKEMTIIKGKKNKQSMNERALEESLNQHK